MRRPGAGKRSTIAIAGPFTILGIESSCDDTAAAVVRGRSGVAEVLSSVVEGQNGLHAAYGGVVPEIAARAHVERLDHCVEAALLQAGLTLAGIDAVAVTAGPGLIGGVVSGVMLAKGICAATGLPLIGVNHLAGHALTPRLTDGLGFPYLMLLVSGGHCQFLVVEGPEVFRRLGGTIDDAPGEAFDKAARLLGLDQPGGPAIEAAATRGDPERFALPRPLLDRAGCDMSFSGLKTALLRARDGIVAEFGRFAVTGSIRPRGGVPGGGLRCPAGKDGARDCALSRRRPRQPGAGRLGWRRGERVDPRGTSGGRRRARRAVRRTATGAVHRQRRDDRLCRTRAVRGGRHRRYDPVGPSPLAPRRGGGADDRVGAQGGQGMRIAVIGAGAFGTALAVALHGAGRDVVLIGRDVAAMAATRRTARLPGVVLDEALSMTGDMAEVAGADVVLLAVSSQALRAVLAGADAHLAGQPLVACCKGIDLATLQGPTATIAQVVPGAVPALLTGPSFAADIARGLPTALTLACRDADVGARVQAALSTPVLRLYRTTDTIGAELGGALKNVVAIGCGVAMGAGLGESARAALMTRGFAEMRRMAVALGAEAETLDGLSGLGDLALTCTSAQSRNYAHGLALGRGEVPGAATVEGVFAAMAAGRIGAAHGIEMPVAAAVAGLVEGSLAVADAVAALMGRPLKEEGV